jgi:hypothetical protein
VDHTVEGKFANKSSATENGGMHYAANSMRSSCFHDSAIPLSVLAETAGLLITSTPMFMSHAHMVHVRHQISVEHTLLCMQACSSTSTSQ